MKMAVNKKVKYRVAPLSGAFMLTSMLGFLITTVYIVYEKISLPIGFSFDLIFVLMFIASIISMTPRYEELK